MNTYQLKRFCPICRSAVSWKALYLSEFSLTDTHILPAEYDIVACGQCGFVYANTSADQGVYDKYYSEMSKYEMNYINSDTSLFINRAARISIFAEDKNASIIDVGCGNGELLIELKKLGYTNLTALDPSRACIKAIREKGIDGIASSIFDVPVDKRYDCVILSGVLEHICDVGALMQKMKKLVNPDGLLFVVVPDAARYKDFDIVPYDYFNIEHINHFDEVSLLNLGLKYAWETVGMLKSTIEFYGEKQPIIFQVYKNSPDKAYEIGEYSASKIKEYIDITSANQAVKEKINTIIRSGDEVVIWGAGNYTCRLLANSDLGKCKITMFVDNDPNKHNQLINGIAIRSPEELGKMKTLPVIVVIAAVFYKEIEDQIKSMNLKNKVVVLR